MSALADEDEVLALGYWRAKRLPSGEWLALQPQIFTWSLVIVRDKQSWRTRYCYEDPADAAAAFLAWVGAGDPPGNWVKQKPEERLNPRWLAGAKRELAAPPAPTCPVCGRQYSTLRGFCLGPH